MRTIAVATLTLGLGALVGCASTTTSKPAASAAALPGPSVELPKRISGTIDLAALQSHEVMKLQREQEVTLRVRLCVAPDGSVAEAKLVSPSGHANYDKAVVSSIRSWKYRPYTAATNMRVCKTVRVMYDAG